MVEATPLPVFRLFDQATLYGIAVHIPQLLDALVVGVHVEVVVSRLPELRAVALEFARGAPLEVLECVCENGLWGFGDEDVQVFGHEDVAMDFHAVAFAGVFQGLFEGGVRAGFCKVG